MNPKIFEFLISQYGLTKSEARFTATLVEGKSVTSAAQENSMTATEVGTTLNRVLLKVTNLFPIPVRHKHEGAINHNALAALLSAEPRIVNYRGTSIL